MGEPGAARNRDRLAAELSPADLALSDRRAAAWTTARRGTGLANPGATYPGVQEVLEKLARVAAAPPPAPMAEPPPESMAAVSAPAPMAEVQVPAIPVVAPEQPLPPPPARATTAPRPVGPPLPLVPTRP